MTVSIPRRFLPSGLTAFGLTAFGLTASLLAVTLLGCDGDEGNWLSAATVTVDPAEITPTSIFVFDTHEQRVRALLVTTGGAVNIDDARIEDAEGPATASVRLESGHADVRITAGDNAGLYRATLIIGVGETELRVSIVAPIAPLPSCDDGNPCTTDYRDGALCLHEPLAAGASCDDNSACTTNDMCNAGLCMGEGVVCADEVECTQDICDPTSGCQFVPDADACDDGDPCTEESCDIDGGCSSTPRPEGSVCASDGGCESIGFCVQGDCVEMGVPDGFVCDDGDLCTGGDTCLAGVCTPGNVTGTTTDALLVPGDIAVNLCDGFSDPSGCDTPGGASPDAVLDVFDADGQSAVLWRTTYLNAAGGACDPNTMYAVQVWDADSPGLPDAPEGDTAADEQFIPPQCTASVFLSTYDWEVRTLVSHEFITNARGAVAARFEHGVDVAPLEDELHDLPNNADVEDPEEVPNVDDEETDSDGPDPERDGPIDGDPDDAGRGAPDTPPEPPEVRFRFVVVAAVESGPQMAYVWQTQYAGANNFDRSTGHFAPAFANAETRPGAVAVDVVDGVVSAVGIEAQRCAYDGDSVFGGTCFPRRLHYTWSAGQPASSTTFAAYDVVTSGCNVPGAMVQQPKIAISGGAGAQTIAVSLFNECQSLNEIIAHSIGGLTTDVVFPRTFTAFSVQSLNVNGRNLYVGGDNVQPAAPDPSDPLIEDDDDDGVPDDDGLPSGGLWADVTSAAFSRLYADFGAVAAAAPDMGEGTFLIASGTTLAIDSRFDDGGPQFRTLPGGATVLPREIAADNDVAAMALVINGFPNANGDRGGVPVPPAPQYGIGLTRLSCF